MALSLEGGTLNLSIAEAMSLLGYDRRWLESGFVSPETIGQQAADLVGSGISAEHYRLGTFRKVLSQNKPWSDSETLMLATLLEIDPDPCMAESVLRDVLRMRWTRIQFDAFANTARRRFPETSELVWQYQVERELAGPDSHREAAEAALRCTLSFVQFSAIDVIEDRSWLDLAERLAEVGVSKEIRHHARQVVRRLRKAQGPNTPKA